MASEDENENELDTIVENISRILDEGDAKLYTKEVISEFKNPICVGRMVDADGVGIADGLCIDTMEFYVKLRSGVIEKCTFFTDGCGPAIACGNRLARFVTGLPVEAAMGVNAGDLISLLNGLPQDHEHCASLAVIALRSALRNCSETAIREEGRRR